MSARLFVLVVWVGLLLCRAPVFAHHSFAAEFNEKDRVALKGTVTKVEWVNPHGWIYMDVKGPDGKVAHWAIETGAPPALWRRGLKKDDLRIGTEIFIDGYRAKTGATKALGRIVKLADGTELFLR